VHTCLRTCGLAKLRSCLAAATLCILSRSISEKKAKDIRLRLRKAYNWIIVIVACSGGFIIGPIEDKEAGNYEEVLDCMRGPFR
jgi:hypothetical protein